MNIRIVTCSVAVSDLFLTISVRPISQNLSDIFTKLSQLVELRLQMTSLKIVFYPSKRCHDK